MALARERSNPDLCLWGNLDIGWLSQPRDEQSMRSHLHEVLDPLLGTPTIFGTSGGLAPGIPLAHLDALYSIVQDFSWRTA
jgi:uroporphyrinogen-III decarboxylase